MKNIMGISKTIVVNGFTRGGTNILWNILQSHPQICAPNRETGELLFGVYTKYVPVALMQFLRRLVVNEKINKSMVGHLGRQVILKHFNRRKIVDSSIGEDNFKFENERYTTEELDSSILCLKSVDYDIVFTDWFETYLEEPHFIGVIRNGYAVCNGWTRRGKTASEAGLIYREIAEKMIEYSDQKENYTIVRFENILSDPFGVGEKLFANFDLQPIKLDKLKLKSKRVLSSTGEHQVKSGAVNQKYWISKNDIGEFFNTDIDKIQASRLSVGEKKEFEKNAMPILKYFNYSEL